MTAGSFRFRDDMVAADVVFEAEAPTLAGLLEQCGLAVESTMVEDLGTIAPRERRAVDLEAESAEALVFRFMSELIFLKDADLLVFGRMTVEAGEGPPFRLRAVLEGEPVNADRHEQLVDVKAVTYHLYRVERRGGRWRAFVVLDV